MQRNRVNAKSDSQLVVCVLVLARVSRISDSGKYRVGTRNYIMFSQSSFNFDRGERAKSSGSHFSTNTDNFGSSCSLFLCVHVRDRASRPVRPVTGNGAASGRDCEKAFDRAIACSDLKY